MKKPGASTGSKAQRAEPPLYQMMVKTLQSEIVRGIYPIGTPLPSESALMQRFGVSRHTAREAVRHLREAGLVRSHQGLGTLVQHPGLHQGYVHHINTITDLFPLNVETRYEPVDGTLIDLDDGEEFLPETTDKRRWLRISALRYKPDNPSPFNELETFVAARFAGVGRVLGNHAGSIYGLLETIYGETIGEVDQIISTFVADGTRGAALGLESGDIGIEVRRVYRIASDGDVALVSFNRYIPSEFSFSMTLRRVRD